MLQASRNLALVFAIGLGIGEAVINWGNWQYAPLWIVDYIIVVWLLVGFFQTRYGRNIATLLSGWAFAAGVFYMALFVSLSPDLPQFHTAEQKPLLYLIGLMLCLAVFGLFAAWQALRRGKQ